jgi:hypothetical protein
LGSRLNRSMKTIALALVGMVGSGALAADRNPVNTPLPLKEVILYSSGVGYFARAGEIQGHGSVQLRFRTEDINDLLKSMVVRDLGGGTIGAITYDSRDPISKTLQSFAIDLTSNPNMRDILNQMRGEAVEVYWPNSARGTILGVERRVVEEEEDKKREEDFLNLFSRGTLHSIPFTQIKEIRLENEDLRNELNEALTTLAKGHDTEKKTVTLSFDGEGNRAVTVAYIAEAPVWKTSYRLVLEDQGGFLQGWAIVENTGDDDWENVRLSLVSGRPISFKMDLYQPLYAPRPTVEPELYLSLRPPVYQDADEAPDQVRLRAQGASPPASLRRQAGRMEHFAADTVAGTLLMAEGLGVATGTASVAQGGITGELFQYALKMPVSIQRQKSAMLPIVTEQVEGDKLSIYNQNVQAKHPLNGFRLKNSSDLHLMQGPITVFDGGTYAGDARIEDLAPGQDRLISYAIDLKTEVEPQTKSEPETLVSVRIRRGTFLATKKSFEEKSYVVRNKDQKKKSILIEHPFRTDWTLEKPKQPAERARDVYRFKMELDAGKTETLVVRESRQHLEEAFVANLPADSYGFYIRSTKVSDRVKDVLRQVVAFRDELAQLAADRRLREDRLKGISEEQARIRENMARLSQNSELYQRYVKKFDEQETEFERLRGEAATLKEREAARQREFNEYLSTLELD